ncbi:MAG: histidine kinase, partial [Clostridia bacterium]|nr:histidine kinase [Clostridia bacterium]
MAMTLIKRKAAGIRLMLCLIFILLVAAGCLCTGYGDGAVQELNSSGNVNTPLSADPFRYNERYSAVMYNNRNGLPTSEANAIAQTSDGFIWIGSYSGLVRYDGNTFERFDPTAGIANVRSLYVDSRERLWIGTNDSGIFLLEKEEIRKWNKKDGLLSVSIRAIAQEENGTIYIGCVPGIAMFDTSLNLTLLDDERVAEQTIRDLRRGSDGVIYGLTEDGDLFSIQQGKIVTFLSHEECRVKNILAILPDPKRPGDLYLGTGDSVIYNGNLERNFSSMGMRDISPLHAVERFENINKQVWICAANGIGRVDSEGFHSLTNVPLTSSVGHVMTDYEGNLWFTSTRQGLMKIVPNQFSDIFEQSDLPEAVVNTTCMYGQQL